MQMINRRIADRLGEYEPEVRDLAVRAVELSQTHSEGAVVEQLSALIRQATSAAEEASTDHDS